MEGEKCCTQCGKQFEESNKIDTSNQLIEYVDKNCQTLSEIQADRKETISEINGSKFETNSEESSVMLNSQESLLKTDANIYKKRNVANSQNVDNSNQLIDYFDKKCQTLNEIQADCKESISEISGSKSETNSEEFGVILNSQESLLKSDANIYQKINVANSQNVIVGNVTYITGPIHITQTSTHFEEQNITNQLFLNDSELERINLNIISRENWMALPPRQVTPLPEAPKYVIIAHTATESGYTEPQNSLLVKLVQTFHMESQKWDDIAYNFLVGCDGNIYEGRGWNIQGAHTYGYNRKSICIAFIGCFMDYLPPNPALNAARKLITEGIKLGFIPNDYTLVGHCQCSPLESPGVQVMNVIKKWPRWRELTPEDGKS